MVCIPPYSVDDNVRYRKNEFYQDCMIGVNDLLFANKDELSDFINRLSDEGLYNRISEAFENKCLPDEIAFIIKEGRFYIYGEEFSLAEIERVCKAYIQDDDIDSHIAILDGLEGTNPFDFMHKDGDGVSVRTLYLSEPGMLITDLVEKIKSSKWWKKVDDKLAKLNGM